jgi:hypothetical protein
MPSARALRSTTRSSALWDGRDLVNLVIADSLSILLIVVSWYQTSATPRVRDELAWLNLGIAGLVLGGVANALWFLRGRQAVGIARALMLPDVERWEAGRPGEVTAAPLARAALVAGPGMSRYHLTSCPFTVDRSVTSATRDRHEAAGRLPCEICEP